MTEKEKMARQMLYDANYDKELINDRNKAKDLCFEYNGIRPSDDLPVLLNNKMLETVSSILLFNAEPVHGATDETSLVE